MVLLIILFLLLLLLLLLNYHLVETCSKVTYFFVFKFRANITIVLYLKCDPVLTYSFSTQV